VVTSERDDAVTLVALITSILDRHENDGGSDKVIDELKDLLKDFILPNDYETGGILQGFRGRLNKAANDDTVAEMAVLLSRKCGVR